MKYSREHPNAGLRCQGHDYHSRCIYHIVLNKAEGIPVFSKVIGIPDDHQWKPRTDLSPVGQIIFNAISSLKLVFPFTSILRRCIMPDHVHFALFVRESTNIHLGQIIAELKRSCSAQFEAMGNEAETKFFIPGYYDTFLNGNGQLEKMLNYISDNPRRYLVRKSASGWFRRFWIENSEGNTRYEAYGNWDLLTEYQRVSVKVSRKYSEEELIRYKRLWHTTILNDGILISPFINPDEKRVRDWAMQNGGAIILLTHERFGQKFKPQGKYFDLCSEGRLLIVHIPPDEKASKYIAENNCPPYSFCDKMNKIATMIAESDFRVSSSSL